MTRLVVLTLLLASACAGRDGRPTLPEPETLSGMRFEAEVTGEGVVVTSIDAETLFAEGLAAHRAGDCAAAELSYLRVADDFTEGRYAEAALYHAALCHQRAGDRARAKVIYARLVATYPATRDARHARFQLAAIAVADEAWQEALVLADALLTTELSTDERMEALVRRNQALLGLDRVVLALEAADGAVRYLRSRPEADPVDSTYFAAAAQFTLGEAHRRTAESITLPPGTVDIQRPFLDRRAEHVLAAQRAYFDTIRTRDPEWSAVAGHRIGGLYDAFFEMIVDAPAPPPPSELTAQNPDEYEREYRRALSLLAKPLLRHSIRYWELALMLIERNGVPTEWTDRIEADLARVRARLAALPEGEEGLGTGG